jgi:hypothetical protein
MTLFYSRYRVEDFGASNDQYEIINASSGNMVKKIIELKYQGATIAFPSVPSTKKPANWPEPEPEPTKK